MSAKTDLVTKAIELGLSQEDAEKKTIAQLEEFLKENGAPIEPQASKGKVAVADGKGFDPRSGKKVRCIIEAGAGPDGTWDVFGSVNGYAFNAKRGVEIELDSGFYDHLKSLYTTEYVPVIVNERETGEHREVQRPRFNITVLREAK